jgi:hypothetical protein
MVAGTFWLYLFRVKSCYIMSRRRHNIGITATLQGTIFLPSIFFPLFDQLLILVYITTTTLINAA